MANGKKRRIPSSVLWGGLGVAILLLGVGSALFYFSRSQEDSEGTAGFVQSLLGRFSSKVGDVLTPDKAGPEAEPRTYTVRDGDNLWAIARKGELVDNPWEWRNIVIQNKDKIDYAFVSQDTGDWKVLMEKGQTLAVRPPASPDPAAPVKKKYALQLMSAPEAHLSRAMKIVKMLLKDGHYAYLYRIEVKGEQYYRIRVGFFETKGAAERAGSEIHKRYSGKKIFPPQYIVFLPSFREMRGERLDFGVQKSKPWVIEFPRRGTHEEALNDLRQISAGSEFAYIAQKKDKLSGLFLYRTRVGYFRTEDGARKMIGSRINGQAGLWNSATVTSLQNFKESLPGQQLKMSGQPAARSAQ